ncbi:MAG: response regulator [Gammaproteobacteria bacterium]|nr:response regulator [Gammaproteobacteria bacterium]
MSRRVLVVDDNKDFRDMLGHFLDTLGYSVDIAKSAKQGLKKANCFQPDLIVVDIIMPSMDGYDFLRELNKSSNDAKVIAVSGGGWLDKNEYLQTAELLGADYSFSKPFRSLSDFSSKVEELLTA